MARADFSFFFPFRVRYAEIDAQGIVFNSHYMTYFDTAVYEYFRAVGFDFFGYTEANGTDFHTVHAELDFLVPSRFDDEIEVGVAISRVGSSSLTFRLELFPRDGKEIRVKGGLVWVHADQRTKKARPLPGGLIDLLRNYDEQAEKAASKHTND